MDYNDRLKLNREHAANPQIGDYWHEMFCPTFVIVDVGEYHVLYCETTKATDKDRWTWDLTKLEVALKKDFGKRLFYGGEKMKDKTWCDVVPRGHAWVADIIKEMKDDVSV